MYWRAYSVARRAARDGSWCVYWNVSRSASVLAETLEAAANWAGVMLVTPTARSVRSITGGTWARSAWVWASRSGWIESVGSWTPFSDWLRFWRLSSTSADALYFDCCWAENRYAASGTTTTAVRTIHFRRRSTWR